jgi:hypothetical protein
LNSEGVRDAGAFIFDRLIFDRQLSNLRSALISLSHFDCVRGGTKLLVAVWNNRREMMFRQRRRIQE